MNNEINMIVLILNCYLNAVAVQKYSFFNVLFVISNCRFIQFLVVLFKRYFPKMCNGYALIKWICNEKTFFSIYAINVLRTIS